MSSILIKENNFKFKEALEFATIKHKGQTRKDNAEYINHPIRVANYISGLDIGVFKKTLIICGYLHDTIEDTDTTYFDICKRFGFLVANIVSELTNDEKEKKNLGKTKYLQLKLNKMSDLALIVKLSDRLDNIKDLVNSDDRFRKKYLKETIDVLAFILNNRKLNETHLNIIKEIVENINLQIKIYSYEDSITNNIAIKQKKKSLSNYN